MGWTDCPSCGERVVWTTEATFAGRVASCDAQECPFWFQGNRPTQRHIHSVCQRCGRFEVRPLSAEDLRPQLDEARAEMRARVAP